MSRTNLHNNVGQSPFKLTQAIVFVFSVHIDSQAILARNNDDRLEDVSGNYV